jgi:large subunit ribosomal protein L24
MSLQRIQTGDTVIVISGRDKGKTGKVLRVSPADGKVLVAGINMVKRHTRASAANQQGGIIEREQPFALCKVMPVDPSTGKGTRVKVRITETGSKVRVAVRSGTEIPATPRAKASA